MVCALSDIAWVKRVYCRCGVAQVSDKGQRMSLKRHLRTGLLLAVVCLASVGCKQYYNGAFGISTSDYDAVQEYHLQQEMRLIEQEQQQQAQIEAAADSPRIGIDGGVNGLPPERLHSTEPVIYPVDDSSQPGPPQRRDQGSQAPGEDSHYASTQPTTNPPAQQARPQSAKPVSIYGQMPGERGVVSPLDSTGQLRRVSFTEEGADFDVTLDRSGEFLIYSSTRHRETSDIYRQRIDGSAITQLTDDSSNEVMPTLSPDGKTIVFASDRSGNWDLYLMDADGGPAVQLTNDRMHDIHPSFSPDGKHLVYCSLGERSGQWQLVTIEVNNPTTKRYIGHGLFPQWSPTSNTILYQRARERGTRWFSVWTVELDDRGEAGSPTEVVWSSSYACITPSWSPDGKAVVFCTVTNPDADTLGRPAESDVWLARADGSGRTRLTSGRFANLQPVWSGDNAIYFVSNRASRGVDNIWAIDPDDAIKVAFPGPETSDTQTADVPTPTD